MMVFLRHYARQRKAAETAMRHACDQACWRRVTAWLPLVGSRLHCKNIEHSFFSAARSVSENLLESVNK